MGEVPRQRRGSTRDRDGEQRSSITRNREHEDEAQYQRRDSRPDAARQQRLSGSRRHEEDEGDRQSRHPPRGSNKERSSGARPCEDYDEYQRRGSARNAESRQRPSLSSRQSKSPRDDYFDDAHPDDDDDMDLSDGQIEVQSEDGSWRPITQDDLK